MGGNASKITARDQAILDLKLQRDKIRVYQRRLTLLTSREKAVAEALLARGDRARALLALRRKKYQEGLLAKSDAQLAQLEQLAASVEFAAIQRDVVYGLAEGARVLREVQQEMGGLERVERLMEDTAEAVAYQREVSELLGDRITRQEAEEVDEELDLLEAEMRQNREDVSLPSVPSTNLRPNRQEQEQGQDQRREEEAQKDPQVDEPEEQEARVLVPA